MSSRHLGILSCKLSREQLSLALFYTLEQIKQEQDQQGSCSCFRGGNRL